MICEMCGKDVESLSTASVEGSVLRVCSGCSKFGTVLGAGGTTPGGAPHPGLRGAAAREVVQERLQGRSRRMEERDLFTELPDRELDPAWPQKIRVSREKLGLTQEQFGQKLNEKTSVIHKLESGAITPSDELVRKIERTLKIRLTAPAAAPA